MKLPQIDVGPVQQESGIGEAMAATHVLGAKQAQMWSQVGGLGAAVEQFGFEVAAGMTRVQTAQARADFSQADRDLRTRFANKVMFSTGDLAEIYGSEEAIPEDIKNSIGGLYITSTNGATGEVTTRPRTDIPRWAVQHQIYNKIMSQKVEDTAQRIAIPGWKNEYIRAAKNEVAASTTDLMGHSMREFKDWETAAQLVSASKLQAGGDFEGAAQVIRMSPLDGARKEVELHKNEIEKAKYPINQVMLENDHQAIKEMISGLESHDPKFDVEFSSGKKITAEVGVLGEQTRREYARMLRRYNDSLYNDEKDAAKKAQTDFEDEFERRLLDAHRKGDRRGMRQIVQALPLDLLTSGKAKELIGMVDTWDRQAKEGKPVEDSASWYAYQRAAELAVQNSEMKIPDPVTGQPIDIRTVDLPYIAQRDHWKPGTYTALSAMQKALLKGKTETVSNTVMNNVVNQTLKTLGHSQSAIDAQGEDLDAKQAAAFTSQALREYLDQEEKTLGRKMKEPELRDSAAKWAASGQVPGQFWGMNAAPKFADIPSDALVSLQKIGGALKDKGIVKDTTQIGLTKFYKEQLEPQFDDINSTWRKSDRAKSGESLTPALRLGLAANILVQKQALTGELENQGVKNPSQAEIVNWYFVKRGWGGGPTPEQRKKKEEAYQKIFGGGVSP